MRALGGPATITLRRICVSIRHFASKITIVAASGIRMAQFTLKVNGSQHIVTSDPETPLLFVLNDELGLRGPRFGCGLAQCGACTVVLRGQVVRSCVMPLSTVGENEITTLEGLGAEGKLHPIQQAFVDKAQLSVGTV